MSAKPETTSEDTDPGSRSRIGFVGLGRMGSRIAANLAGHHEVMVWNRTPQVAEQWVEAHGGVVADSLSDLAA
ncbi:MAG TPA: NAD(P)-binding domain-containing protein, partial [Acidimicrobiia bacterium]|nr:NAD(P)-binding domain-containing protein [Acidimicrobiia bacterium]